MTQTISIRAESQVCWSISLDADARPVPFLGIGTETQAGIFGVGRVGIRGSSTRDSAIIFRLDRV